MDPSFEGQKGCTELVEASIVGGGVKNAGSYIIKTLPSPPSAPLAPLCVTLIPFISVPKGTSAVRG